MIEQGLEELFVDPLLDLEADRGAAAQVFQLRLDLLEEVFRLFLVDVEIAVAGDAKQLCAMHVAPGKQLVDEQLDDLADEDEDGLVGAGRCHPHHARQHARHRHDREVGFAFGRIRIVDRDDDVERLVADLGKRMRRIDRQRREHGKHLVLEIVPGPPELAAREFGSVLEHDALGTQRRDQFAIPAAVLVVDQRGDDRMNPSQLLAGAEPVERGLLDAGIHLLDQTRDADLKELVEIAADDRQEPQAFQQRRRRRARDIQHPAVEGQPAQLPVEVRHAYPAGERRARGTTSDGVEEAWLR